ncbi:hypothetical protein ROJ8625_04103 [Roseivivax jejudonensis]|uniref:Uncharacterized protein n=1 Tax=Roseivivax jejudonensis TaxID=1529041 RepID=A0A1X7AAW4_9RHOB|nr:hypothetical protein [Roseivivax jejudonensis]SLN74798.1 hypothetical protein ROJ8625_04103 [Roseivivax jejudonensis]
MAYYALITTSRQIPAWPGAEKERGEFAVERQLGALGIEAHAPRKITFKRQGKRRHPDPIVEVLCPNYVFADIPDDKFFQAMRCRGLSSTTMRISEAEARRHVQPFIAKAAEKAAEAYRIIEANDRAAMCQYEPGELLEVLTGPLAGRLARFRKMVHHAHDMHPSLEVEIEAFGGWVPGQLDPIDAKRRA